MSQKSTNRGRRGKRASSVTPLAVCPSEAARLLSLGVSRTYQLMRSGALISYRDGRLRRVTMASIRDHMARQLAAGAVDSGWRPWKHSPPHRKQATKAAAASKRRARISQQQLPAE